MIIYIGFSTRTHKFIAHIICHKFKHCAPIIITNNKCKIYQFTKYGQIEIISIKRQHIKILEKHGWKFIKYDLQKIPKNALFLHSLTCVQFTKKFCGINRIHIQTPDALLKYLTQKCS